MLLVVTTTTAAVTIGVGVILGEWVGVEKGWEGGGGVEEGGVDGSGGVMYGSRRYKHKLSVYAVAVEGRGRGHER